MSEDRQNLTARTVERLKELIHESGLAPGESFGIEADLEKQLSVSRPVLREAISRLRGIGLLESRQSVGLIIGQPNPVELFEQAIEWCAAETMELYELAEFRYALETGVVDIAVRRATAQQIHRLKELADRYAAGIPPEWPDTTIDKIELEFHRTLFEATHNPTLTHLHRVIATYFARAAKEVPGWIMDRPIEGTEWEHRAIARAMAQRNAEQVRVLLSTHLRSLLQIRDQTDE